jgi:rhamnosyltransferase
LVIVDSGSKDATLAIAREHGARIVPCAGPFGYGRSLNLGFAAASSPWVLVLSSHCIPIRSEYLDYLRARAAGLPANVAVVYGPCVLAARPAATTGAAGLDVPRCLGWPEWEREKRAPGGNGNALYRYDCWQRRRFDESLRTAEDLEWLIWALRNGYQAAQLPGAEVLYRNQGSLKHMFAKGLHESRLAGQLADPRRMSWPALALGLGSLLKNLLRRRISLGTCLRQAALQYGAFIGSRHPGPGPPPAPPSKAGPA